MAIERLSNYHNASEVTINDTDINDKYQTTRKQNKANRDRIRGMQFKTSQNVFVLSVIYNIFIQSASRTNVEPELDYSETCLYRPPNGILLCLLELN